MVYHIWFDTCILMSLSVHKSNKVKTVPSKALWIYLNCSQRELASLKHRL